MKRYFALFLTFILIFNFVSFSYADTIDNLINVNPDSSNISSNGTSNTTSDSSTSQVTMKDSTKSSGILSTIIEYVLSIFDVLNNWLIQIIYVLPTIDGCIFNTQDSFKISVFDTNPVGLSASLQSYVAAIYNAFRYLATAIYIVVLVYLAIRMMFSAIGRQKARYKELFKHWIVGLLLLFSFHWVMAFVLWISNTFVDILYNLTKGMISDIAMSGENKTVLANIKTELFPITSFVVTRISCIGNDVLFILKPLLVLVAVAVFIGQEVSIMITYLKRLFTIMILILLFPLIALSYVFDKIGDRRAQTFEIWLKEFITNVMIQPLHALVLVFISMLFSANTSLFGRSVLGAVMVLVSMRLIPLGEELLKKVFQISSSMGPGSHGIAGSLAHAGMAINGAKNMISGVSNGAKATKDVLHAKRQKKDLAKQWGKNNETYKKGVEQLDKDLMAKYGTTSLGKAMAKDALKATPTAIAGGFGLGMSVTGSGSGHFLADASARAAIYGSLGNKAVNALDAIKQGDTERAKKLGITDMLKKLEKPEKMSQEEKKNMALKLKMSIDAFNENLKNPEQLKNLKKGLKGMDYEARFGDKSLTFNDLLKRSSITRRADDIRQGINPDTGGALEDVQTTIKDNSVVMQTSTGETIDIGNKGSKSLAGTVIKPEELRTKSISKTLEVQSKKIDYDKTKIENIDTKIENIEDNQKTINSNIKTLNRKISVMTAKLRVTESDTERKEIISCIEHLENQRDELEMQEGRNATAIKDAKNERKTWTATLNTDTKEFKRMEQTITEYKNIDQGIFESTGSHLFAEESSSTQSSNIDWVDSTPSSVNGTYSANSSSSTSSVNDTYSANPSSSTSSTNSTYSANPSSTNGTYSANSSSSTSSTSGTYSVNSSSSTSFVNDTSSTISSTDSFYNTKEEQFSYGVCPSLSEYLNNHSDKSIAITLVYVDDHTLSVKAANEQEETKITVTSDVIYNIFGSNYLPVTLYFKNGAWYRQ